MKIILQFHHHQQSLHRHHQHHHQMPMGQDVYFFQNNLFQ